MNKEVLLFTNFELGLQVRAVEINGKPYFVATDIAKALGYVNPNDAVKKHCRWVAKCEVPHPQSKTKTLEVNVIPEGDMYRLITNSELPSAENFESWIFDEVLPQIRQTGGYIPVQEGESEADILAKALRSIQTYASFLLSLNRKEKIFLVKPLKSFTFLILYYGLISCK